MRLLHGDAIYCDCDGAPIREVVGAGFACDVDAAVDGVAVFGRAEVPGERPVLVSRGRVVCAQGTAADDVEVEVEDFAVAVDVAPEPDWAEYAFGSAKVQEIFYHDDNDDRCGGMVFGVGDSTRYLCISPRRCIGNCGHRTMDGVHHWKAITEWPYPTYMSKYGISINLCSVSSSFVRWRFASYLHLAAIMDSEEK